MDEIWNQNGFGWKGPLRITQTKPPDEQGRHPQGQVPSSRMGLLQEAVGKAFVPKSRCVLEVNPGTSGLALVAAALPPRA